MLIAISAIMSTANAQTGQGRVFVINETSCDVYIDVYAICPDCSVYGSNFMHLISPNPWYPGTQIYDPSLPSPNPYWSTAVDPASNCEDNWQWSFAVIDFICGDGSISQITVGNPSDPCATYNNKSPLLVHNDCLESCFGGDRIWVRWTSGPGPGDIIITIGN